MSVSGYGGTGFLAKEVVQDLLHTPLFLQWCDRSGSWMQTCIDVDTWCPCGPGARKGLNLLHHRQIDFGTSSVSLAEALTTELVAIFKWLQARWPAMLENAPVRPLRLHSVQFQLCEFGKFCRAKAALPAGVRRYVAKIAAECLQEGDDEAGQLGT